MRKLCLTRFRIDEAQRSVELVVDDELRTEITGDPPFGVSRIVLVPCFAGVEDAERVSGRDCLSAERLREIGGRSFGDEVALGRSLDLVPAGRFVDRRDHPGFDTETFTAQIEQLLDLRLVSDAGLGRDLEETPAVALVPLALTEVTGCNQLSDRFRERSDLVVPPGGEIDGVVGFDRSPNLGCQLFDWVVGVARDRQSDHSGESERRTEEDNI